jgi:hypothetical protein
MEDAISIGRSEIEAAELFERMKTEDQSADPRWIVIVALDSASDHGKVTFM